ncbi:MarR family winged helix-turn-helix transcriptional regulator [uncultured Sphingomonas sp.]|uniref:MarR family winged helix-turn-helix transcriptional regulator n=1 Tax=uncultured Sphingomonas sp. TaxID=158754 RepID=UPI0035CA382C
MPLGLSSGYLPVLTALMPGERLAQKVLTERAGIEQPTMAATLGRMERDGVIEREPDPDDRRSALVRLTPQAIAQRAAITAAIDSVSAEALARVDEADRTRLRRILHDVIAAVEVALGDP